ncbi:Vacuolar calcium ion transporter [Grifola frondosa]|uniref:Vacuolar calcium ion transporter n=1 Tax=Grifola frondosa TaxID=5627 RepID=A0A1C7M5Z9_GRIFR|nr:Vacuolar calcium ion transporter [Grifola frondosa]
MSRATSQCSSASYSSASELVPHRQPKHGYRTFSKRLFSWSWRQEKLPDFEMNQQTLPPQDKGGGDASCEALRLWHGWRTILFDSWFNVLILLIPVTWVLKLCTTHSDTLVFIACLLAMIPLVKLHDLATWVLSNRIGGTKTGLLNASMSNIVELVVAIIALRKCELRVVQSSLIGSMLSKLLLILGMCFFAGGTRFSEQDFDSTATQIHSSLLSISVDAVEAGTTLDQQKQDLLRMSHGVAIVLLFIYGSYLLFQLWSHPHLYQDNTKPSDKLPVAASVISVTSRVRRTSNTIRERISLTHLRSTSKRSLQSLSIPAHPVQLHMEKDSPLEEAPETSFEEPLSAGPGPYVRTAYLVSPFGTTSQVTLSEITPPPQSSGNPTVRLIPEYERRRDDSPESASSSDEERRSQWRRVGDGEDCNMKGRSRTRVSEVLSAYFSERGEVVDGAKVDGDVDAREFAGEHGEPRDGSSSPPALEVDKEPEPMSWTLTILLLTVVTVLVAINSEWLVDSMDDLSPTISKEWIGLILLPTVSSIAECVTAINVSVKDQLTLSISVAVGSTIQTALFVIPAMVILGWVLDKPLALLFDPFESVVLYISVHTMGYVVADGKSNWLEGVILVCLYIVIAVTFWFYPGSNFSSNLAVCVNSTL